jgi:hypothetical protein
MEVTDLGWWMWPGIVKSLCEDITKYCPQAWVAIISNPVNSTVPIAAEVFKKCAFAHYPLEFRFVDIAEDMKIIRNHSWGMAPESSLWDEVVWFRRAGTYDPRKLLGVTKLDVVRAKAFVGEAIGVNPEEVNVPVIGGHAGITILPLLSQVLLSTPSNVLVFVFILIVVPEPLGTLARYHNAVCSWMFAHVSSHDHCDGASCNYITLLYYFTYNYFTFFLFVGCWGWANFEDGHVGVQATPHANLAPATVKALTERIQDAGTEVVKAKVRTAPR